MSIAAIKGYELIKEQILADIGSTGYLFRHIKSGARVCVISNEDDNKVFSIGFKTAPKDSTGVPHIIEHSVLCGSDKFPVKDPFIELVKGSLNTFLNAITFPDKTVYPVASYNDKDYENLMDVYLDAVFHPNILKYPEIFKQEGWHYELESEEAPLTINGVVYSEMKGAYSSAEEILQNRIMQELFPGNCYGKDSGGNPQVIPQLSYEDFLKFYKENYHPSNSYIYMYGDMDIAERLQWMDENYLAAYDVAPVTSHIPMEAGFEQMKDITAFYPIASDEEEEDNSYLSYTKVVGTILDKTLFQAFDVLDYALVSAPGAPVRQALIDAGIGEDVYGGFDSGMLQPTFGFVAKNANGCQKEEFVQIIEDTLRKVVAEGLNPNALLGAINSQEFRFREADYGQFPKGLLYGLQCMDAWIFDEEAPFLHLECLETFAFLKEQIGTGYFEGLIQDYLLDNTYGAVVTIEPKKGLLIQQEEELAKALEEYKNSLSEEEIQRLIQDTKALKEYQEAPDAEEDQKKIPMLTKADLKKEAMPFANKELQIADVPVIFHEIPTNGIDYINLLFDAGDVALEDIPYLGLLRGVLGLMDTKSYTYNELANAINIHTGGLGVSFSVYPNANEPEKMAVKMELRLRVLDSQVEKAFELVDEILHSTKTNDTKRLAEIIAQTKSRLQSSLSGNGNVVAAMRAMSYSSIYGAYQDATGGIAYYNTISQMDALMKEDAGVVVEKLQALLEKVFVRSRLIIGFTAEEANYNQAKDTLAGFISNLPEGSKAEGAVTYVAEQKNEGFTDASGIAYVACSGNYRKHGYEYSGTLRLIRMILSYDYLWQMVRVLGGAYGCGSMFGRTGESYFSSYRDPNLGKTIETYHGVPEYLRTFQADERDMTKYIIGTFGALDTPLTPEGKGSRSMAAYLQDLTLADVQKERDEILNATVEDIRGLAPMVEAILSDGNLCVVGNESMIHKEKEYFKNICKLNA